LARDIKPVPVALGFRVKSGWAMAVLLAGPASEPKLVRCQAILLSDPKIPQSKQPHHAALELPEKEGKALSKKLRKIVADAAKKSVSELVNQGIAEGYSVNGAGLGSAVSWTPPHFITSIFARMDSKASCFEPRWKLR
jgi:hypothetical protein